MSERVPESLDPEKTGLTPIDQKRSEEEREQIRAMLEGRHCPDARFAWNKIVKRWEATIKGRLVALHLDFIEVSIPIGGIIPLFPTVVVLKKYGNNQLYQEARIECPSVLDALGQVEAVLAMPRKAPPVFDIYTIPGES